MADVIVAGLDFVSDNEESIHIVGIIVDVFTEKEA